MKNNILQDPLTNPTTFGIWLNFFIDSLGHGDKCYDGVRAGCLELLNTIQKRVQPKFNVFGHIHEGRNKGIQYKERSNDEATKK